MNLILGERLYEKSGYPKYTKKQMDRFVIIDCPNYTGIQAVLNVRCWLRYGCYMDTATKDQRKNIEDSTRGFFNVDMDMLFNLDDWDYKKDTDEFIVKEV